MGDVIGRWEETAELFSGKLVRVQPDQWDLPSPCSEWNVRQLVEHAVGLQARLGGVLGGIPISPDWDVVRPAMSRLLVGLPALDASVEIPGVGPLSVAQTIEICVNDLLIHTWDVARAIGADETLPEPLVAACLAWLRSLPEAVLRSGRYADARPINTDDGAQAQMLAFAGRPPATNSHD